MIKITSAPTIIKISLKAIWANKMRSALTSLGIIIGVGAVIAMMAVGDGASADINARMASVGSNIITIRAGAAFGRRTTFNALEHIRLTTDDAAALRAEGATVRTAYGQNNYTKSVVNANQKVDVSIVAAGAEIFDVQTWTAEWGRVFTQAEVASAANVCVLGATVTEKLFGDMDPIDTTIRIANVPFKVIGVFAPVGQGMGGSNPDESIAMPVTTGIKTMGWVGNGPKNVNTITVQSMSIDLMEETEAEIVSIMRQRHRLRANQEDDFTILNLTQMMETVKDVSKTMGLLLAAIASISLLVGGIGIMNIMLVSVTERTREIGIRMAIGASMWDIRMQFLAEAIILSLFGGIIGMLLGSGGAWAVHNFAGLSVDISAKAIIMATSFSAAIGILFGFYPAYKASKLNPIDALRFE